MVDTLAPRLSNRFWLIVALCAPACPAAANYATTIGFAVFDNPIWFVWIGSTLVIETIGIRYFFKVSWLKAAYISFVANLVTAVLGAFITCFGFPGDMDNPQPFVWAMTALSGFAFLSAITEAWAWAERLKLRYRDTVLQSLATHLIGFVLGIAILLIPQQPYSGVEEVYQMRGRLLISGVPYAFRNYGDKSGKLPDATTANQILRAPHFDSSLTKVLRMPHFSRFGQVIWTEPSLRWNEDVSGRKLESITAVVDCAELDALGKTWRLTYDPADAKFHLKGRVERSP